MKTPFIILFLSFNFCCINSSYSQKTVTLTTTSVASFNQNKYSKIDIITNLPDSNNLGFIPSDILNDRKYIQPSGAVTTWLQSFVNKQFALNPNAKADALLWVIQDLSMGKDSTQKEVYSFLKLKADVYSGDESNYQLINTYDSTWIVNGDADFGQMIAAAFVELFKNSAAQSKGTGNIRFQSAVKLTGTKNDIASKVKMSNNHPITKTNEYADGVYLSFDEFKNNTPSVSKFYADVNLQNNKVELYQIAADSSSELIKTERKMAIPLLLILHRDHQELIL